MKEDDQKLFRLFLENQHAQMLLLLQLQAELSAIRTVLGATLMPAEQASLFDREISEVQNEKFLALLERVEDLNPALAALLDSGREP